MLLILSKNRILFAGYFLFLIIGIGTYVSFGKKDTHLLLTGFHAEYLDFLMKSITILGDGIIMAAVGLVLLFYRMRYGIIILGSFLLTTLAVQVLKRLIFPDFSRPVLWFHNLGIEISRMPGFNYHSAFSFPSGHSATSFALFFGIALLVKSKGVKLACLMTAILVAYSRVYLSQHFLEDALAGSLIGAFVAVLADYQVQKRQSPWMDKNILTLIRKKA